MIVARFSVRFTRKVQHLGNIGFRFRDPKSKGPMQLYRYDIPSLDLTQRVHVPNNWVLGFRVIIILDTGFGQVDK